MAFIRSAMDSLSLPGDLQLRIVAYHHYLHVHHNATAYDCLFNGLSLNLLVELKLHLFRQLFIAAPFFKDASPQLIQETVLALMECTYSPGDIVILKDSIGHEMFFIVKGKCEVLSSANSPMA